MQKHGGGYKGLCCDTIGVDLWYGFLFWWGVFLCPGVGGVLPVGGFCALEGRGLTFCWQPMDVGIKLPNNGLKRYPQGPFWPFWSFGVVLFHLGVGSPFLGKVFCF